MTAPVGAIVSLYVDLVAPVATGDVIETATERRYRVVTVRVQLTGKHAGRQHLTASVLAAGDSIDGAVVHRIRWYARGKGKLHSAAKGRR